ncbi:NFATC2-interacting protein isoform X2 [Phyllopteryx taeniolatus]|uniref:NFATC2-interacting protein isoform X2 n=1 Tax=Phyllopteryx taeniolatus TaxID=161469 RepID=UPI002AD27B39|nr:NFATC2-interacting protein isoform X2 [Phyllopteryx taeniolatus]
MAEQGRKTVRQFWTPEDTQKLIKVTTDQEQDLMQPRFHGNQMWEKVVREMGLEGKITVQQASKKWKNLVQRYEELRTSTSVSGADKRAAAAAAVTWVYYDAMHRAMSGGPSARPPVPAAPFQEAPTVSLKLPDGDAAEEAVKPAPKRRRILDSSAIVPVPVYSNKVNSSLRLKAELPTMMEKERTDDGDVANLWSQMARREGRALAITISDSDDEPEVKESPSRSPPPPPAEIPFRKQSRRSKMKIKEVDRRLRAVSAIFSPEAASTRRRQRDIPELDEHDDDVIVLDGRRSCDSQVLKTTSVGQMVSQMAAILGLSSFRLRLLREEAELPADASVGELGLDITDILECVVMATEEGAVITVRLQGKDRGSGRDFSVHKGAELGAIFSQYVAALPAATKRKVKFHFDGCKVTGRQTPAQLDMEDGDIIEVWT